MIQNTGLLYAGTCTTGSPGDFHWNDVANAVGVVGTDYAWSQTPVSDPMMYSDKLYFCNFGAAVPADATVLGIKFELSCRANPVDPPTDVQNLCIWDINLCNNFQPISDTNWVPGLPLTKSYKVFGGESNNWGMLAALTPTLVNATNFGITLQVIATDSRGSNIFIYGSRMTIYYSDPVVVGGGGGGGFGKRRQRRGLIDWKRRRG